jgi:hypothetical protein
MSTKTLSNLLNTFVQDIRNSCRTTSSGTAWNDIGEAGTFRRALSRLLIRYTTSFTVEEMTQQDAIWTLTLNMGKGEKLRFCGWKSFKKGSTIKLNDQVLISVTPSSERQAPVITEKGMKTLLSAI